MKYAILLSAFLIPVAPLFAEPDAVRVHAERGDALRTEGRFAEAIAEYKKALSLRFDGGYRPADASGRSDGPMSVASRLQRQDVQKRLSALKASSSPVV